MKRIAIFGAPVNNGNLGCLALTYSLLIVLEGIARERGETFEYHIFELNPDEEKTRIMARRLGVEESRIYCRRVGQIRDPIRFLKHLDVNLPFISSLRKCDAAIDLTQGDSFSDIYGEDRFYLNSNIKLLTMALHLPLILGPQTYGPFQQDKAKRTAKKILSGAKGIISRDKISSKAVFELSGRTAWDSTDIAFFLPYANSGTAEGDAVRIGINVSGLLTQNKTENTVRNFSISADYDLFVEKLLEECLSIDKAKVYLISHVAEDYPANKAYKEKHPEVELVDFFEDPVSAKSFISTMNVFIGSRMHAAIAALSAGVATIPVAYSRKFAGLFQTLQYDHVVDLTELDTDAAVNRTVELLRERHCLQQDAQNAGRRITRLNDQLIAYFRQLI